MPQEIPKNFVSFTQKEKIKMYVAIKDDKIIDYNKTGNFPLLNYDRIEEVNDDVTLVQVDGEFLLNTDEKVIEFQKAQIRSKRDSLLQKTDKFMISDYPISEDERQKIKLYREYLRDYTLTENWWQQEPKEFS